MNSRVICIYIYIVREALQVLISQWVQVQVFREVRLPPNMAHLQLLSSHEQDIPQDNNLHSIKWSMRS